MVTRRTLLLACTLLSAAVVGCVEGPFAHSNPNDPDFAGGLSLAASRDTVTTVDSLVALTLVSERDLSGYRPLWISGDTTKMRHSGDGVFRLRSAPVALDSVLLSAYFLSGNSASRWIYLKPVP